MDLIRSILFALIFYPGSLFFVTWGLIGALFGPRGLIAATHGWARFHRRCAKHLLRVKTRLEGAFPPGPHLIASKHQSMFETVEYLVLLDQPAVVMKRELADLPGWGKVARLYGVIPVDRDGGAAALRRMLNAAREAVGRRKPILIFPEGTRVRPGEQPPLQPGFAGLYKLLGLPVVPVALDSGRIWPRGRFRKRRGTVTMRVGETIPPGLPRAEIEKRVHFAINLLEQR